MKVIVILSLLIASPVFALPVNINTDDAKTISKSLKGVGPKKADEIIKYRADKGDFKTVDDLKKVPGIGEKTVEKNRADILLTNQK
jgi:competence protein ComEA